MRRLKAKIVGCLDAGRGPLPQTYTEHLQVLRYEPGQFYKQHHDQNSPMDAPYGPRVFTFFTYLSNVTSGGGTKFHRLGLGLGLGLGLELGLGLGLGFTITVTLTLAG